MCRTAPHATAFWSTIRHDFSGLSTRAFSEKVESIGDSHEAANMIQASHWGGGQHEWRSLIRATCARASLDQLRRGQPLRRPLSDIMLASVQSFASYG